MAGARRTPDGKAGTTFAYKSRGIKWILVNEIKKIYCNCKVNSNEKGESHERNYRDDQTGTVSYS